MSADNWARYFSVIFLLLQTIYHKLLTTNYHLPVLFVELSIKVSSNRYCILNIKRRMFVLLLIRFSLKKNLHRTFFITRFQFILCFDFDHLENKHSPISLNEIIRTEPLKLKSISGVFLIFERRHLWRQFFNVTEISELLTSALIYLSKKIYQVLIWNRKEVRKYFKCSLFN